MADDLTKMDATAQAELVRSGAVSPRELVDAAIERVEKLNPQLNAVIRPRYEKARAEADSASLPDGPLKGVPFLLKDLFCVHAGDEIHSGCKGLKEAQYTAPHSTYLAEKFRAAGLITIGQTNTPEFGFATTTEPEAYGPTRNPWNTNHSTGGSSGGSAAAVASRIVPVAHANDGGGSIRIPASACGLVGLKPSRGRLSLGPDYGEAWAGCIAEGVVSLSVRDAATVLDATAGSMPGDPYTAPACEGSFAEAAQREPGSLRIGLMTKRPGNQDALHSESIAAAENTAKLLESLGHRVEVAYPEALDEQWGAPFGTIVLAHSARTAEDVADALGREVGPGDFERYTWDLMNRGRSIGVTEYIAALEWLERWERRLAVWWADGFDLLLTSTLSSPAPPLGQLCSAAADPDEVYRRVIDLIPYTPVANVTGQPGISLPLHWSEDGLPVGVHLMPAYGREDVLLSVAAQLEQAQPWIDKLPPVCA